MSMFPESEPTCREIVELVTDYLEDAMTPAQRARFDAHIVYCEDCQAYLGQMRETIRLTGRLSEDALPLDVREALVESFRGLRGS